MLNIEQFLDLANYSDSRKTVAKAQVALKNSLLHIQ